MFLINGQVFVANLGSIFSCNYADCENLTECIGKCIATCDSHSIMQFTSQSSWVIFKRPLAFHEQKRVNRTQKCWWQRTRICFAMEKKESGPSVSCQKKQIFLPLCHKGEWAVLLSCRIAVSKGSPGTKICMELTDYHYINRCGF